MLGDFGNMNMHDESILSEFMVTSGFVLATFLVQITILNMLIAIMGQTFSEHIEE